MKDTLIFHFFTQLRQHIQKRERKALVKLIVKDSELWKIADTPVDQYLQQLDTEGLKKLQKNLDYAIKLINYCRRFIKSSINYPLFKVTHTLENAGVKISNHAFVYLIVCGTILPILAHALSKVTDIDIPTLKSFFNQYRDYILILFGAAILGAYKLNATHQYQASLVELDASLEKGLKNMNAIKEDVAHVLYPLPAGIHLTIYST